jgi:chromosome segregation ATPase
MSVAETVLASLKQSLSELRGHFEEVGESFHREFQSLDQLRADFIDYSRHLEKSHQHLQAVESRLTDQQRMSEEAALRLQEERETLRVEQLKLETVLSERAEANNAEQAALEAKLATLETEKSQLQHELGSVRHQASELVGLEKELAASREEIQVLKANLEGERSAKPQSSAADGAADSRIQELEAERGALEFELEDVRVRAVELAESLSDRERRLAEERAEWSRELKELRRVLEQQAKQLAARDESVAEPIRDASMGSYLDPRSPEPQEAEVNDLILGSVMAQFEMLQKDKIGRRGRVQARA